MYDIAVKVLYFYILKFSRKNIQTVVSPLLSPTLRYGSDVPLPSLLTSHEEV
jgi:hypothetical protein